MKDISDITLYSGGHKGAEAEFGRLAEEWGIKEVNFVFEGHSAERTTGLIELDKDELKKGDVSMEIVSMHMKRRYSHAEKIRKVFQAIFHMVNKGYHVIAVGWIQEDGTVKGGTGWGVELAKLFNRPLSVFDQDKKAWFCWEDSQWVEKAPVITSDTFSGTGTRNISDEGKKALRELFTSSFGEK